MVEEDSRTIWCGNIPEQITEEVLYELFLQAGPLESVKIPKDRTGRMKPFAFITYKHNVSVPYAISLLRGTNLFNRTISLQYRGRMPLLPPPIRCYGPDTNIDFSNQPVVQQFSNMTDNLRDKEPINEPPKPKESDNHLVMASLQGNWTHRHHPYRAKEQHNRDNFRPRDHDHHRNRDRPSGNWRDRRYNKKSYYQRRD